MLRAVRRPTFSGAMGIADLTPVTLRVGVLRAMSTVDGARRVAVGFAATGGVGGGADLLESGLLAR